MIWSRAPEVLWRRSDGRVVLLPPSEEAPQILSGTGAELWLLIDRPRTDDDLVDELVDRYVADRAIVERDVRRFLDQLMVRGILRCEVHLGA